MTAANNFRSTCDDNEVMGEKVVSRQPFFLSSITPLLPNSVLSSYQACLSSTVLLILDHPVATELSSLVLSGLSLVNRSSYPRSPRCYRTQFSRLISFLPLCVSCKNSQNISTARLSRRYESEIVELRGTPHLYTAVEGLGSQYYRKATKYSS
ncbi:hypothetical protein PCASD_17420 [Puccinia coronata f. sp. avenae]|uniref:Uncharacterized protein n=1 Tax=Puccinia coronata f. sp. avenae TaxID=200324 RepID=A0A2N5TX37_9BASI|nr:hypothetical protein PCASD_17420 [Puccinia coronata f. sp. avenae]